MVFDIIEQPGAYYDGTVQWWIYDSNFVEVATGIVTDPLKVATGETAIGNWSEYDYSFSIPSTVMPATQNAYWPYWLGLHVNTTENYTNNERIAWESTGGTANPSCSSWHGIGYWNFGANEGVNCAFNLYGTAPTPPPTTVPEPSSLMSSLTLLMGVVPFAAIKRRRRLSAE